MNSDRITCLVPTHNRPHFLRRLLRLYLQFQPGYPFLIVDSSAPSHAADNLAAINDVRAGLNVKYVHLDLGLMDKCVAGLERIRSPFVAFCADDDYLLPDAVTRCVEFLENHSEYASAMGRTAMLNVKTPLQWPKIIKGYSVEHERPFERCRQMAQCWFTNFYAVHRSESLLENFRIAAANTDSQRCPHLFETLLSQLSMISGRAKLLPVMYSLREQHRANTATVMKSQNEPQVERLYQRLKACLTEQYERAGIIRDDAVRFFDDARRKLRDPSLTHKHQRPSAVALRRLCRGLTERAADYFSADCTRHRRFVRNSDLAGCESIWRAAVKLIRDYPQGIPREQASLRRCA